MKKGHFSILLSVFLILIIINSCSTGKKALPNINYPDKNFPDTTAKLFAPGIISTELHDDASPVFSPDGENVFFRIVIKEDNSFYSPIFEINKKNSTWSKPELAPFSGKYLDGGITFLPDQNKLLFCSRRGKNENYNIDFWITRINDNKFTSPENIEILNTPNAELYPCMGPDNYLYWTVETQTNDTHPKSYRSKYEHGKFSKPELINLFPELDELYYIFDFSKDGTYLIMMIYDEKNRGDLYVSFNKGKDEWGNPIRLQGNVNSPYMEKAALISPDGKYLFFVSNRPTDMFNKTRKWDHEVLTNNQLKRGADVYWVSTEIIENI